MHQLVEKFRIHSHSKTCSKYKNMMCRFKFRHFFTEETIIANGLQNTIIQVKKFEILNKKVTFYAK